MNPADDSTDFIDQRGAVPIAVFDASHGQPNWAQTGFTSREMHSNFAGLTEMLCRLGFQCRSTDQDPLDRRLADCRLLVLPSPTGRYEARKESWRAEPSTLFTSEEVLAVLKFLHAGGSLIAFAYRFGDSFTHTNLRDIFTPLGCQLNDDAVIDAGAVREIHPLQMHFDTRQESLPLGWSRTGVTSVRWRPSATFTILPGAIARPLALSTGGGCLSFNRTLRRICFEPLPVATVGQYGRGRFALFGGPHVFETSSLGLLSQADNTRFLQNILNWLIRDDADESGVQPQSIGWVPDKSARDLSGVDCHGEGARTISSVERVLRKSGILKALGRARWMP